ncbi:MAG: putative signal transduction histidine kinase [Solirubrobacterales bacterium]|nr:putative signal transduction histidine kinase [Solirubrobacterales bacterium]
MTQREVEPLETMLDVAVELLSTIETIVPSGEFYTGLCDVVCRMTVMERAGIWLYDMGSHRVEVAGVHGADLDELARVEATVENTPIARRALLEDRVVVAQDHIEDEVPADLARVMGLTTLTCTPIAAAGRWYGVLLADRGGERFELADIDRDLLRMISKILALAAGARITMRQQERARRLADRLNLAREIHERVMQRLFGVSLVLASGRMLGDEERERCAREMSDALADLRTALRRPLARASRPSTTTLREEIERLPHQRPRLPTTVQWREGLRVPEELEGITQSVLSEALTNVRKHAEPTRVEIVVDAGDGALVFEMGNDGLAPAGTGQTPRSGGMGLRLASFEALQHGGLLEFGETDPGWWRVRLVVPMDEER